jgi:hypothetical protein
MQLDCGRSEARTQRWARPPPTTRRVTAAKLLVTSSSPRAQISVLVVLLVGPKSGRNCHPIRWVEYPDASANLVHPVSRAFRSEWW